MRTFKIQIRNIFLVASSRKAWAVLESGASTKKSLKPSGTSHDPGGFLFSEALGGIPSRNQTLFISPTVLKVKNLVNAFLDRNIIEKHKTNQAALRKAMPGVSNDQKSKLHMLVFPTRKEIDENLPSFEAQNRGAYRVTPLKVIDKGLIVRQRLKTVL